MSVARRLFPWSVPPFVGPLVVLVISALGLFAVFWGIFNPMAIDVVDFDAGDASQFAVHRVVAFPEQHLYLVGMEDGRIRALDGRVQASNCRVEWLPDDPRGAVRNPQGLPGVFRDPCSGALWSFEGNAISGTNQPLRTPHVTLSAGLDGRSQRVSVELVNPSR
ncbi:MAG: hypothetical protein WC273_06825 [Dehalococcoidia bacterium]